MSYQQTIRSIVLEIARVHGRSPDVVVEIAVPGTFQMRVLVTETSITCKHVFDLSVGLTPRTSKAIRDWAAEVLSGREPGIASQEQPVLKSAAAGAGHDS